MDWSLLQELYDSYRFWDIFTVLVGFIRKIDLYVPISCRDTVDELRSLLEVIENTDFRRLTANWSRRACQLKDASPGRVGDRSDLLYYEPISRRSIDQWTAECRSQKIRVVPPGHPVGYEYSQDVDVGVTNAARRTVLTTRRIWI